MSIRNIQASIFLWFIVITAGAVSDFFLDPLFIGGNNKAASNLMSNFKSEKKLTPTKYINNGKYELVKPPKEYDGSLRFWYNDQANSIQVTKEVEADPKVRIKLEKLELMYRQEGFRAQY